MAKIRYTISTSTPKNHAERPLFVTSYAVIVAISIITTAPARIADSSASALGRS